MTFSIHVAGWTLVHFLWQGALVGLVAAAALRLLYSASAQTRYAVDGSIYPPWLIPPLQRLNRRRLTLSAPHSRLHPSSRWDLKSSLRGTVSCVCSTGGRSGSLATASGSSRAPMAFPLPARSCRLSASQSGLLRTFSKSIRTQRLLQAMSSIRGLKASSCSGRCWLTGSSWQCTVRPRRCRRTRSSWRGRTAGAAHSFAQRLKTARPGSL
jgi:hypothetical protein